LLMFFYKSKGATNPGVYKNIALKSYTLQQP
jgi:hypothetical protein